jgi:hypothetical protein
VRIGTFWGFENLDLRKYNEVMSKLQNLGRRRNEEHLNSKQKDFQRGKSQTMRIFSTQSHLQTLHQALLSTLILPCMHLQVTYNIKMLKTPNPWIIRPIFVHKNNLV